MEAPLDPPAPICWKKIAYSARKALSRFRDEFTRHERADLVQEGVMETWRWRPAESRPGVLCAAVRTTVVRLHGHGLRRYWRRLLAHRIFARDYRPWRDQPPATLKVQGEPIAVEWLVEQLGRSMCLLSTRERALLLGIAKGRKLAEVARELGWTRHAAARRVYRSRKRLRAALEAAVREQPKSTF